MPSSSRDGIGDRLRVAGHHHDLDACLVQPLDRLARLGANGVGDREGGQSTALSFDQVDRRLAARRAASATRRSVGAGSTLERAQAGSAHRRRAARPSTIARTPRPGIASKSCDRRHGDARAPRRSSRSPARSDARSRARRPRRGAALRPRISHRPSRCHDAMLAERERARLVEDDGREIARLLEPAPVAHEQPAARAERRRDRDAPAESPAPARAGRRSRAP